MSKPSTSKSTPAQSSALTLIKALDVLEAVSHRPPMTVIQIASHLGLNRTTTHRLVQTLIKKSYLRPSSDGRGFEIGLGVLPLAASHLDRNKIRLAALPHLHTLARDTGQGVNLGVVFQKRILYLAGVEKPSLPNVYSRFGKVASLNCSSLGKAIMAWMPDEDVEDLLNTMTYEKYTRATIVDRSKFVDELAVTRDRGYAVDMEEHINGIWCVASPVFADGVHPVAAISISGNDKNGILEQSEKVKSIAQVVAHVLSPFLSI